MDFRFLFSIFFVFALTFLLLESWADVSVSTDGSGDFFSIMDAVNAAPNKSEKSFVIRLKKGVYKEKVVIAKNKWNLKIVGEGADYTIITGNLSRKGNNIRTFDSAILFVKGRNFIAENLTVENTAGPVLEQAVAILSQSNQSVFYRVRIKGYQDALYVHSNLQFYRECEISGTVDFIFGKGTAVFQECTILVRNGLPGQDNVITANSRISSDAATGFSFQFCKIIGEATQPNPTYLGRPWSEFSRTIFMQSYLDFFIQPKGWKPWNATGRLYLLYYGEYLNHGPGAKTIGRVSWIGYHVLRWSEAEMFTVKKFLHGNSWLPLTGINYTSGLYTKL